MGGHYSRVTDVNSSREARRLYDEAVEHTRALALQRSPRHCLIQDGTAGVRDLR